MTETEPAYVVPSPFEEPTTTEERDAPLTQAQVREAISEWEATLHAMTEQMAAMRERMRK